MREIKFRAWLKEERKMVNVETLFIGINRLCFGNSKTEDLFFRDFEEVELMQYTGLKDKNSKEIYEGDIVLIKLDETSTWYKTVVGFKKGAFIADLIDKEDYVYIFHHGFTGDDFEIIGNVYENKNLLEENK
jgi:hypothetical protein